MSKHQCEKYNFFDLYDYRILISVLGYKDHFNCNTFTVQNRDNIVTYITIMGAYITWCIGTAVCGLIMVNKDIPYMNNVD